jgi:hypothetical protein
MVMKTILLDTSIDYTSWDISEAGSIEMTEWQPIETAPKDGTLILLHRSDGSISPFENDTIVVGKWIAGPWQDGSESKFVFGSHYYIDEDNCKTTFHIATATHWMPLPPPPKKGDE